MSKRKNILLLALLLLIAIVAGTYFALNNKSGVPVKKEVQKGDSTEIRAVEIIPKADTIELVKEPTPKPKPQKTIKPKVKIAEIVKDSLEQKSEKREIGSIGELIADTPQEILRINKAELITEPIDLPEVPHYVFLKYQRVEPSALFVPKGQWLFGGTVQYSDHTNTNYKLLVLDDWEGKGYTVTGSMYLGYAIKDNLALGVKAGFGRTLLNIDNLTLNLGDDLNFNIDHAHYLNQQWSGTIFMRNFFSLFKSRQFGLFNDTEFTLGGGRGKMITGTGEALKGTYESFFKASIGISPGIMVFIQNIAAIEVSVGLLGFNTSNRKQITNQVYEGSRRTSGAKFGVDILSIKLGGTIYLNSRRFEQR